MKAILLLAIVACVLAQGQHRVCLPEEFTTDQATFEPERQDVFVSRVWFSMHIQKTRLDVDYIVTHDHPRHERVSVINDYTKGLFYNIRYDLSNNTATCKIGNLTGNLEPVCLSKHAELRGKALIGAVLHCDNFIERVKEHDERVMVDIMMVSDINVPIRVHDRRHDGHEVTTEFWNFKESVQHESFNVPSVCNGDAVEYDEVPIKSGRESLRRLRPNGALPPTF